MSRIKQYSLDLLAISEKPWSMAWQPTSYRHKFSYWSQEMIVVNSIINFLPFTQTTDHLFTHALKHRGNYTCRLLQRITFNFLTTQCIYMCYVRFLKRVITDLIINIWMFFVMVKQCAFCTMGNKFLYFVWIKFLIK